MHNNRPVYLSLLIPVYNEKEGLTELFEELTGVLEALGRDYEIIFIDDHSTDGSSAVLGGSKERDGRNDVYSHNCRMGKIACFASGIKRARGEIIMTMDSDLQDDPKDIPAFIAKIHEGFDLVCGWRKNRKDGTVKIFISEAANKIISFFLKIPLHDINCGMKAFKNTVVRDMAFDTAFLCPIPFFAQWKGCKIAEVVVSHRPRKYGSSKYGFFRYGAAAIDLFRIVRKMRALC